MTRKDRVQDPATGRWYKAGYSPAQLMRPIAATCGRCGGDLTIYPDGSTCATCSPPGIDAVLRQAMERTRVRRGYIPTSEE